MLILHDSLFMKAYSLTGRQRNVVLRMVAALLWLTAAAFAQTPVINSAAAADVEIGYPFHYEIKTQLNNALSYRTTAPLPAWLALSSSTGVISGTAPQSEDGGTITRQLIATNGSGDGPPFQLTLTVIKRQRPAFATGTVPQVESRPGAAGILFIDFLTASEAISGSFWNNNGVTTIDVHPCGLSTAQMNTIYEVVKEDFLPFNLNVTTKRSVYDSRSAGGYPYKRMRCIVTTSDRWLFHAFGIGGRGVGEHNTFRLAGTGRYEATVPMFAFVSDFDASGNIIESPVEIAGHISHEFGHALGLFHDQSTYSGASYFPGTGRYRSQGPAGIVSGGGTGRFNVWTPIMGLVASGYLTQWSQGEYWGYTTELDAFGQPKQGTNDDVAVIAGFGLGSSGNDIGFASDDIDDTLAGAVTIPGVQPQLSGTGFIGRSSTNGLDHDYLKFTMSAPGKVDLLVTPAEPFGHADPLVAQRLNLGIANLYMTAELRDSANGLLDTLQPVADGPTDGMPPGPDDGLRPRDYLRRQLAGRALGAGTYYLKISPAGVGNPNLSPEWDGSTLVDVPRAFTAYGSMGAYTVNATIRYTPDITSSSSTNATVGLPFEFPLTANQTVTTWSAPGLPNGLSINSSTGWISGVPTAAGTYVVNITADNRGAVGTGTLTITIAPGSAIAAATDNNLTWTTPGGGYLGWFSQAAIHHDGVDAAQSGPIGHGQIAAMQAIVPGPGTVTYWRKVQSEFDADFFIFSADGIIRDQTSGDVDWVQKTFDVPAGSSKILRWEYRKDGSISAGQDAAWVDQVVYTQILPPVVISASTLTVEQGTSISYPIIATNNPTSYVPDPLGGNVPGMSLQSGTNIYSGTPTVVGEHHVTLGASNLAGTGYIGLTVTVLPSLADALDNTAQTFTRSGDGNWVGQTGISQVGGDAAKSAVIGHGQSCVLQTTVIGPSTLTFWWKTDCEATNDYVICKDNGVEINGVGLGRRSGSNSFTQESYSIGSGSHTITWTYQKNGSVSTGADAAWVDGVAFGPAVPVITSQSSISAVVGQAFSFTITATNGGTITLDETPPTNVLPPGVGFSPTQNIMLGVPYQGGTWSTLVQATNGSGTTTQRLWFYIESSRSAWNRANGFTGENTLAMADSDGDGLPNVMEMALQRNPSIRDDGYNPVSPDPATGRLRAVFRYDQRYRDITYIVETSPNLSTWTPLYRIINGVGDNIGGASVSSTFIATNVWEMTIVDPNSPAPGSRRFMRMSIVEQ